MIVININSIITGATSGVYLDGNNIKLGGNLAAATTIGTNGYSLTFAQASLHSSSFGDDGSFKMGISNNYRFIYSKASFNSGANVTISALGAAITPSATLQVRSSSNSNSYKNTRLENVDGLELFSLTDAGNGYLLGSLALGNGSYLRSTSGTNTAGLRLLSNNLTAYNNLSNSFFDLDLSASRVDVLSNAQLRLSYLASASTRIPTLATDGTVGALAGSGLVKVTSGAVSIDSSAYITLTSLSSTATGLTYTNTTGVFSLTSGYVIPTTTDQTNWNTAYTDRNKWDGGSTGLTASTGRTSLGATTVGGNLFTLTNPSAITFIRINADNSVSTLDAATFRTAIGAQSLHANLTSISGLTYASASFVKMTAAGTFALDTNTYLTSTSGVTTVAGTANQVLVNGGTSAVSGAINLSLPQSIHTLSSPTFAGITVNGNAAIGGSIISYRSLNVAKNITGGTAASGISSSGNIQSDVTAFAYGFVSNVLTQATAFTLAELAHFGTATSGVGAGSTIGSQYGFYVASTLTGATNNYGFYSNLSAATGRWNFYAAGTAANYFEGNILIGTVTENGKLNLKGIRSNTISQTTAIANIGGNDASIRLGLLNGSPNFGGWISVTRDSDNLSFPLLLQPSEFGIVSIGSTTTTSMFNVGSTAQFQIDSIGNTSTTGYYQITGNSTTGRWSQDANGVSMSAQTSGSKIRFLTNPTGGAVERMRLTELGNLTIGSPTATSMFNVGSSAQFQINSSGVVVSGTWNGGAIADTYISSATNWNTAYTDRNKWDGGATGLTAATGRTSLGATTVGGNLFTLTNPSAITFIRINADNSVSTLDAATFRTAIGAQSLHTNLTSLSGLTYASASFVKMTAAGTFALDTNTYLTTISGIAAGGDLSGTYASPTVAGLQSKPLADPSGVASVVGFGGFFYAYQPYTNTFEFYDTNSFVQYTNVSEPLYADTDFAGVTALYIRAANGSQNGYITYTDWTTFNNKQAALSGTGIVKSTSGTISYITDNSTNWNTAYTQTRQWDGGSTGLVAATGRTSLGATTVGGNLFTLTNPSAITFIRINADNSVSTLDAATYRTAISAQALHTNLTSLSGLTYASASFVKMTATGTFALDTNTYTTGSGTNGKIPLWNGSSSLTDSIISASAFLVTVAGGLRIIPPGTTTNTSLLVRAGVDDYTGNIISIEDTSGSTEYFSIRGDGYMKLYMTTLYISGVQTGNSGLSTGEMYFDTAANILANSDLILARKN